MELQLKVSEEQYFFLFINKFSECQTGGSIAETCEPGWSQIQKKCYKLESPTFKVTWDVADTNCKSKGALLATIESQCEQDFVVKLANKAVAWIGGTDKDKEGTFVWPSGTEFFKSNAAVSGVYSKLSKIAFNTNAEDAQDCVTLKDDTGEWDDIICTKTQDYICEKAAYAGAATFMPTTVPAAGKIRVNNLF